MTTNVSREQAFSVLATNFSISPSSSGYTLQVSADGINYSDLFAVGANVTRMVTGVASGSYYKLRGNTDTNVIINWERQCNDGQGGGGGGSYVLPAATQSTLGGVKVGAGLSVTPDGTLSSNGGGDSGIISLDNLDGTGREGEIYEYNGRLFKWVEGAGATGKWLGANIGNANYNDSGKESSHSLIYTQLPTNTPLCSFRYIGNNVAYLAYDGSNLVAFSDSELTTTVDTINLNETEHHLATGNGNWYITWVDGLLTIRASSYCGVIGKQTLYDNNPHFVAFDIDTLAHPTNVTTSDSDSGVPVWNKEGVVIGKSFNYYTGRIWLNGPRYQNSKEYFATNGNFSSQLFIPTQGGTAGQVLVSAGEAEPQWTTMIKAQQITSADYEALATKDPNVLYLIIDE